MFPVSGEGEEAMDFRLDDAQIELQQTIARFCQDRFPLRAIGERDGRPVDRGRWREMAELGVFALLLPPATGGSGLGAVEGALVFEQLGSHLVPGPVLWSVVAAPLVEGAATGSTLVGGVVADAVRDGVTAVEHAADLDVLLVVDSDEVRRHDLAALDPPVPLDPLDPLTPVGRVHLRGPGEVVGDAATVASLRRLGTVLSAALLTGIAGRALEVAQGYALEREQFGAPIGSFQAVKHLLADMYLRSALAQSATYAAAAVLDDPSDEAPDLAAAGAKLLAAEAALANAGTAVQVLGGMGFTWEMLPHHLLKRAWVLEHGFGTRDDHAHGLGAALVASVP